MLAGAAMGGSGIGVTGSGVFASEPAKNDASAVLGGVTTNVAAGLCSSQRDPHKLNKRDDRD